MGRLFEIGDNYYEIWTLSYLTWLAWLDLTYGRIPLRNLTLTVTSLRPSSLSDAVRCTIARDRPMSSRIWVQNFFGGRPLFLNLESWGGKHGPRSFLQVFGPHAKTIWAFWFRECLLSLCSFKGRSHCFASRGSQTRLSPILKAVQRLPKICYERTEANISNNCPQTPYLPIYGLQTIPPYCLSFKKNWKEVPNS